MKKQKKITRIRILMIISHLLLTGFVVYWLLDRYSREKDILYNELIIKFNESEQKMLDTMILRKMINPVLENQLKTQNSCKLDTIIGISNISKPNNIKTDKTITQQFFFSNQADSVAVLKKNNSRKDKSYVQIYQYNVKNQPDNHKDSLLSSLNPDRIIIQGLKLYVNMVSDSFDKPNAITLKIGSEMDTSLLKKNFEHEILKKGFKTVWLSVKDKKSSLYISSQMLENKIGAKIENYTIYLLQKLLPNITFGLILLIITGVAFIISFINLKKQIQLNKLKNDFVSNISHELKTPVATVKVALEAIQNFNIKNEPEVAKEYMRIASHEINRLENLIQKVLDTSIYEEAKEFITKEPLDLELLIQDVLKTMEIKLRNANCRIEFINEARNCIVMADRMHLESVFNNLIDNSLKYSNTNPCIQIRIDETNEKLIISVSDNGIGIPEEFLTKVFDKFFRVPNDNKHNVKGYGLGLYYASEIMKQHQGKIAVENNDDIGCTFTLEFPGK